MTATCHIDKYCHVWWCCCGIPCTALDVSADNITHVCTYVCSEVHWKIMYAMN